MQYTPSNRRRGTAALEFALLALPFLALVLGMMEFSYDYYVTVALGNAVHVAARGVQLGAKQGDVSGKAGATWVASSFCPALGGLLNCSQLYVSITPIPSGTGQNYYSYIHSNPASVTAITAAGNSVCTGTAGKLILLEAYYLGPTFVGLLLPGWSQASPLNPAQQVHVSYASAGFVNEYFSGGETGC